VKRALLLVAVAALAGCGGGSSKKAETTTAVADAGAAMRALAKHDPSLRGKVRTLYQSAAWAVVESQRKASASAVAFHLVGGRWVADRSGGVKLEILAPKAGGTAGARPQVSLRFTTATASVESALWIDGSELVEQGGGTLTRGTINGTPQRKLAPGPHVAVAYARSRSHGAAVAWVFSVG
jgi:hypothetical protein